MTPSHPASKVTWFRARQFIFAAFGLYLAVAVPANGSESPYPNMVRLNGSQPILPGGRAMFPSLVKVPDWVPPDQRAHPEAIYYLYWARHHGSPIRMSWSRKIEGPYTEFNSEANKSLTHPRIGVLSFPAPGGFRFPNGVFIRGHISSPEVMLDDRNRRFIMFFHGPSNNDQKSFVATSPDGLNFNPPEHGGVEGYGIVPQILNSQYMRTFMFRGDRYAVGMNGILSKAPDSGPPYIIPPDTDPLVTYWTHSHVPVSGTSIRHAAVRVRDEHYLDYFFSRRQPNEQIEMVTIDMAASDWTKWFESGPSISLIDNSAPWEGDNTRDPAIYEEQGNVYLLYSGGHEDGIGLALLDGKHPLPSEPLPADYAPRRIVEWGLAPSNADANIPLRRKEAGTAEDEAVDFPFDETTPLSPSSGYSGQPFYGGMDTTSEALAASLLAATDARNTSLDLRSKPSEALHACVFFDKRDFRNIDPTQPVAFDKYSAIRIKADRIPETMRFVVRNGTEYFVSESTIPQSGELRFRGNDHGRWAPYDPRSSLNFDASKPFEPRTFKDITGVGIVIDGDSFEKGRQWLRMFEFEVIAASASSD